MFLTPEKRKSRPRDLSNLPKITQLEVTGLGFEPSVLIL